MMAQLETLFSGTYQKQEEMEKKEKKKKSNNFIFRKYQNGCVVCMESASADEPVVHILDPFFSLGANDVEESI